MLTKASARARENRFRQGDTVRLELFPGESVEVSGVRVEDAIDGSSSWIGCIDTPEEGAVVLTLHDGHVYGRVDIGLDQYVIETDAKGRAWVSQIDSGKFPQPGCFAGEEKEISITQKNTASGTSTASAIAPLASSGHTVDVLVLYTPASVSQVDPATPINNLIADASNSYTASGIDAALRVVGYRQFNYVEPSDPVANRYRDTALAMQNGTGDFTAVPSLRSQYAADLVVLLVDGTRWTGACGYGLIRSTNNASESANFAAVIAGTCAIGDRTFTHELGHKMSARHNWKQASEPDGLYDNTDNAPLHYNHGYWNLSPSFKDIMGSYPNCNLPQNGGCPRINRWSSPTQTYSGVPLGTSTEPHPTDMVMTLNQTVPMVAQYATPAGMSAPGALGLVDVQRELCYGHNHVSLSGSSGTIGWYELYASTSSTYSPQTLLVRGPNTELDVNVGGTTYLRARACNAAGCSAYTNGDTTATYTNGCF